MNALGVLNQQGNRLLFPVQQQNAQQPPQQAQQQPQQTQQQPNLVGLPGPSPTTSNPGLSPFGNPLSQGSTSAASTNSQFPATSNGPVSLPQVSPAGQNSQSNQFSDMLKNNLMGPSPSSFVQQQQQNVMTQQQPNQQAVTLNNTPRIPSSGADTITAQLPTSTGPKSASSSRGPSPAPATPIQSSPAAVSAASMGEYYKEINIFHC